MGRDECNARIEAAEWPPAMTKCILQEMVRATHECELNFKLLELARVTKMQSRERGKLPPKLEAHVYQVSANATQHGKHTTG